MIRKIYTLLFVFLLLMSCSPNSKIKTEQYELQKSKHEKSVLIIFPCFMCSVENTKQEANFLKDIQNKKVTTLILNYNQKLFLEDFEKKELSDLLESIFKENNLNKHNVFYGGFSSGGNIALLLGNYQNQNKTEIIPKGIFVVDSPLDLELLYKSSQKDVESNGESAFLIDFFENSIGNPIQNKENYIKYSPFLVSEKTQPNLDDLKFSKIRFYSESDFEWFKTNRNKEKEELNFYHLLEAEKCLKTKGFSVEFIKTKNRGYRANGDKHPHSWNLVEQNELLNWIFD